MHGETTVGVDCIDPWLQQIPTKNKKMQLNFPDYNIETKNEEGRKLIYDIIRRRFVALTPEEWVRQHVLWFLVETKQYSRNLIAVEREIKFNNLKKDGDVPRPDLLIVMASHLF